jgi:ADP-heptose:LPS heptosyltransferase
VTSPELAALRRILVIKLSSLGDVVHVTPCLRALRRACPAARIAMAVDRRFAALVRGSPYLDEVIEADAGHGRLAAWLEPWRHLAGRRRPGFDLAIDFQGSRRSALWTYASGARVRAGLAGRPGKREWRPGWQHTVRSELARHAVRVCADVAGAIGVPVEDLDPELWVSVEADRRCAARLAETGLPPRDFVLVNPFTRWPSKSWPVERYRELVNLLHDQDVPVVVHAGPGEDAGLETLRVTDQLRSRIGVVDGLSLEEALALFRRARLMVTGDTGPMHCAAALGIPVVALFGPTWPEHSGPWGKGHRIIQASRPSTPQAYRTDADRRHIRAIEVASVHRAVLDALSADRPERDLGQRDGPPRTGKACA